jgi:hypothetical protein
MLIGLNGVMEPKNIRKILQNDPELSELWRKLEEGGR